MVETRSKNNWYQAFKNFSNAVNFSMDCAYHASVISYDKKNHTADIQPLANYSDGSNKAQVLEVPVSKCCYQFDEWVTDNADKLGVKAPEPMMHEGAIVVVDVLDNDSDESDGSGSTYTPQTGRQHDINDSRIVGCL